MIYTSSQKPRPNFFIIGAMKSGTTSLHSYLNDHPDIFMCHPKEPSYFVERSQHAQLYLLHATIVG